MKNKELINAVLEKLSKEVESIRNDVDKSNTEKNPIEVAMLETIKAQSTVLIRHIMNRCVESEALCQDVLQDHKEWSRCMKYVTDKAKAYAFRGPCGMVACIPDNQVFEWAEDYYHLDDKAQVEEEREKLAKQKAEREQKAKEDAEKEALARKKAIAKLSAEEGWEELPEEEKEKKIKTEARNIKYSIGNSKTSASKKTPRKTTKKEENISKEEVTKDALSSSHETNALPSNKEYASNAQPIPFEESKAMDEDITTKEVDDDCEQLDLFSMYSM